MKIEQGQFHIVKTVDDGEERTITGPVLRPEIRDQHESIVSGPEIRKAAFGFLKKLNESAGPGFMHEDMDPDFQIVASWVTLQDMTFEKSLGVQTGDDGEASVFIPEGTWMMTMQINNDTIWEGVKSGVYKGFSIGGKSAVELEDEEAA